MIRFTCIALMLFSASVCFSQNSEIKVKDASTNSASKSGLGQDTKVPSREETIGTTPFLSLGTPSLEINGTSNENPERKHSTNGKNEKKPN